MKKSIVNVFQYLFFLALGILFAWLTLKDINEEQWNNIKGSVKNARHWLIIPVVFFLLLSHYSRAIRWKILMQPLGYTPSTFNTFASVMIGYLVNAGVPRLGEVVKCTLLSRYENVKADKLIGTIVIERAVDLVCLLVVFILAILFQGQVIGGYVSDLLSSFSPTKMAISILAVLLTVFLLFYLSKRFRHINAVQKVYAVLKGVQQGLNSIRFIKQKRLFLFHTIAIWMLYLLSTTMGIYALQETDHLGVSGGITTLGVGSIGMIITPGGIGAYPFLVEKLMLLYHISEETGKALGWLLWSVQTVIVVLSGVIFAGLFFFYNKNKLTSEAGKKHIG